MIDEVDFYLIDLKSRFDKIKPNGSYKGDTQKELQLINEQQFKLVKEYFKESYEVLGIKPYRQLELDLEVEVISK